MMKDNDFVDLNDFFGDFKQKKNFGISKKNRFSLLERKNLFDAMDEQPDDELGDFLIKNGLQDEDLDEFFADVMKYYGSET